ncbi:MAG: MotA/TolQ/ExbB proton channel family protein [Thermoanaerobaculia bacterium]|nr:MotA/TolQ/ExbB proton channel family protein [Thermoanaerobaculia bacterium]
MLFFPGLRGASDSSAEIHPFSQPASDYPVVSILFDTIDLYSSLLSDATPGLIRSSVVTLGQAGHDGGIIDLFLGAGPMAWLVFGVLGLMSVGSWAIMVSKAMQYRKADLDGEEFLEVFRRSKRFSEVNAAAGRLTGTPMVGLFQAGYAEIDAQVKAAQEAAKQGNDGKFRVKSLDGVERSLRRAIGVELSVLDRGTAFLATTAASAPFIGLFGTVWGIMVAFNDIGASGSASLAVVAPGIAEALINTAAGLAAAIPALMGFNYFGSRLRNMRGEMQDFVLEFMNLTERNFT